MPISAYIALCVIGMFFLVGPYERLMDFLQGRRAKKAFQRVFDGLEPVYGEEDINIKRKVLHRLLILERIQRDALIELQNFYRSHKDVSVDRAHYDNDRRRFEKGYHDATANFRFAKELAKIYGYLEERSLPVAPLVSTNFSPR